MNARRVTGLFLVSIPFLAWLILCLAWFGWRYTLLALPALVLGIAAGRHDRVGDATADRRQQMTARPSIQGTGRTDNPDPENEEDWSWFWLCNECGAESRRTSIDRARTWADNRRCGGAQ
jgi:hypothetical protein